ncbi:hypothetical protein ACQKH5_07845 [Hyphomonas sp. NPDC076900]|uniref:hypothetical protein n=1 Tax=unclassified Hyphomonas TaxID=2630699 RepID=UPI003D0366F8
MDRGDQGQLGHPILRAGASLALATLFLAGCSSVAGALLAPKIDTAASRLTPGDFALDTKHAALVFRINHLGFSGLPTNTAWIEAEAEFIRQKPD